MHECMAGVILNILQIFETTCICQFIERCDLPIRMVFQSEFNEMTTDESRTTRDKDINHPFGSNRKATFHVPRLDIRQDRHVGMELMVR